MPILICIAIPVFAVGVIVLLRSWYGEEFFGLGWHAQDLNRDDDYRLIKLRLNGNDDRTA